MSGPRTISVAELAKCCRNQPNDVIDVRTSAEYRSVHIPDARNVPLDTLEPLTLMQSRENADQPLYFICQGGSRGATACRKLLDAGYTNVVNVEGGTQAWDQAGLPVVRGKHMMSLERQVRIAAGLLVLIGSLLGYFVHPYFIGLAVFVGAGLTFAGITNTCGMGMMLARMPWNQVPTDTSHTCCTSSQSIACHSEQSEESHAHAS